MGIVLQQGQLAYLCENAQPEGMQCGANYTPLQQGNHRKIRISQRDSPPLYIFSFHVTYTTIAVKLNDFWSTHQGVCKEESQRSVETSLKKDSLSI